MENASKAFILAGSVLIAIMVISLGVYIFNRFSITAKESANLDEQEISSFNSKIRQYMGNNIAGSQINGLIDLVRSIDNNALNKGDTIRRINVYDEDNNLIAGIDDSGNLVINKVVTGVYYTVTGERGSSGLFNKITVTSH